MSAKKQTSSRQDKYTKPALRERLKKSIQDSSKGGAPGQWSARKAQLLASEYKKKGGGFKGGPKGSQKSLKKWTDEKWQTAEGSAKARSKGGTKRYLPKKAWDELPEGEKKRTNQVKKRASKSGKQFVSNTPKAKAAGKKARKAPARTGAKRKKKTAKKTAKKTSKKTVRKTSARTGKKKSTRKKASGARRKKS